MRQENEVYENHHCTEDGCPVNDQLKEEQFYSLSIQERARIGLKQAIEEKAMDAYFLVLECGGTAKEAQAAYFSQVNKLHSELYS